MTDSPSVACSTGAEDSRSASSTPDTEPSGTQNSTSHAAASSTSDGPTPQTTETSHESIGRPSSPSKSSAPASLASPSASLGKDSPTRILDGFGLKSIAPFAFFDPATSFWRMSQASFDDLLKEDQDPYTSSSPIWPRQATWDLSCAYELLTSEPAMSETGGSASLLPTPQSADHNRGPDFAREHRPGSGGDDLTTTLARVDRGKPRLLPTPVVTDSFGSRRSTAKTEEWASNDGTTLTDAIWETQGRTTDTRGKLLPTPMSNQENPGAGGELRAAITHGPGRRNETGVDSWGRPNRGRSGASTPPPSTDGKQSSEQPLPGQLTIGDA